MISLLQGATGITGVNDWILTLSEDSFIDSPDYIFYLTSQTTGATVCFYAPDISGASAAYNRFLITAATGPSAANNQYGKPYVTPTGYWMYQVFEAVGATPHVLNITGLTEVERGLLQVTGELDEIPTPTDNGTGFPVPNDL